MTAIRGTLGVNKRPGELGIHTLAQFNLVVPDLTKAEAFYSAFGLDVKEEGNSLGIYTHKSANRVGLIQEDKIKRLNSLSFNMYEEDFEPMKKRIEAAGIKLLDPPVGIESEGLWFRDPVNGFLIELRVGEKMSPDSKPEFGALDRSAEANSDGSWSRQDKPDVHPDRFAHLLFYTPDVPATVKFFTQIIGLRLSDHTGDMIAFMHAIHGSDHHVIGIANSNGRAAGLHHISWDVGSINMIGLGAMQMADKGFTKGWGLGRHVIGSNYFHYMQDPWGSWCEYSADIDYISCTHDWEAKDQPPEDGIYVWGPDLPEDFLHNYEADGIEGKS